MNRRRDLASPYRVGEPPEDVTNAHDVACPLCFAGPGSNCVYMDTSDVGAEVSHTVRWMEAFNQRRYTCEKHVHSVEKARKATWEEYRLRASLVLALFFALLLALYAECAR